LITEAEASQKIHGQHPGGKSVEEIKSQTHVRRTDGDWRHKATGRSTVAVEQQQVCEKARKMMDRWTE